uniref:Uncharacterized protein n=1 Tax=Xiangshan martelli-like virus 1 TaxID=2886232 RepID=A0A8K1P3G0_9VIRU|nr:MAG: hypothetical protein [Xiangshan martelli-like virus 1]
MFVILFFFHCVYSYNYEIPLSLLPDYTLDSIYPNIGFKYHSNVHNSSFLIDSQVYEVGFFQRILGYNCPPNYIRHDLSHKTFENIYMCVGKQYSAQSYSSYSLYLTFPPVHHKPNFCLKYKGNNYCFEYNIKYLEHYILIKHLNKYFVTSKFCLEYLVETINDKIYFDDFKYNITDSHVYFYEQPSICSFDKFSYISDLSNLLYSVPLIAIVDVKNKDQQDILDSFRFSDYDLCQTEKEILIDYELKLAYTINTECIKIVEKYIPLNISSLDIQQSKSDSFSTILQKIVLGIISPIINIVLSSLEHIIDFILDLINSPDFERFFERLFKFLIHFLYSVYQFILTDVVPKLINFFYSLTFRAKIFVFLFVFLYLKTSKFFVSILYILLVLICCRND